MNKAQFLMNMRQDPNNLMKKFVGKYTPNIPSVLKMFSENGITIGVNEYTPVSSIVNAISLVVTPKLKAAGITNVSIVWFNHYPYLWSICEFLRDNENKQKEFEF